MVVKLFFSSKVEKEAGYNMPDPIIYPTPYGARLEFMLPNNNLMYVHLKNKDKIRLVYGNI